MARLTAQDMVEMVRDYCGGETSETLSDIRLLRFLNQASMEVCSRYKFHHLSTSETVTASSGTADYDTGGGGDYQSRNLRDQTVPDCEQCIGLGCLANGQTPNQQEGLNSKGADMFSSAIVHALRVGERHDREVTYWRKAEETLKKCTDIVSRQ